MKESTKNKLCKWGFGLLGLIAIGGTYYLAYKYGHDEGKEEGYKLGEYEAVKSNLEFLYDDRVYPNSVRQVSDKISINWHYPIAVDDEEREWLNKDIGNDQWRARIVIVEKPNDYDEKLAKNPPKTEMRPVKINWTQLVHEQYPDTIEEDEEKETEEVVG